MAAGREGNGGTPSLLEPRDLGTTEKATVRLVLLDVVALFAIGTVAWLLVSAFRRGRGKKSR